MEDIRFRNHFSVVLENVMGLGIVLIFLIIQNLENVSGMILEFQKWQASGVGLKEMLAPMAVLLVLLLVVLIVVGINALIWSKTWTTITESAIILERNTLNKVSNTIGMKNISNVNIEQNIWEKILGTCKIKLDTNSLSTANSTDIKIVLKKSQAMAIQQEILRRVNIAQGQETGEDQENQTAKQAGTEGIEVTDEAKYDMIATNHDILLHGICSINVTSLLILLGCIGGAVTAFTAFQDSISGSMISILANLVIMIGVIISCLKGVFGGFITYHDFKVGRRGNKIHVHYGLLRTIDYTIPVSKINAVIIHQTFISRIMKRYMVELVNVGMGDEDQEAGAFIILACDRVQLQKQLDLLLPEFASVPIDQIKRQPKAVIWNKLIKTLILSMLIMAAGYIVQSVVPEIKVWWVVLACAVLIALGIVNAVLQYYTAGTYWDDKQILAANGCFRRDITVMSYANIQYLKMQTNIILKHWGLVKGEAYLLAAMANQTQSLPVCEASEVEPYIKKYSQFSV